MEKLVKGALLTFVSAWGISRGIDYVNGLLNVRKFSKIADFKLSRIHQISFVGFLNGYIRFFMDLEVINPEDFSITAENISVKAFNEKNEFVGESLPYPNSIVIAGRATTTISNIEVHVNTAKALFDYAYEAIAKVIQAKRINQNFSLGRTLTLNISMRLNGVDINKTQAVKL